MENRVRDLELGLLTGVAAVQLGAMLAAPDDRARQEMYVGRITQYLVKAGVAVGSFTLYQASSLPGWLYKRIRKGLQNTTPEKAQALRGMIKDKETESISSSTSETQKPIEIAYETPVRSNKRLSADISPMEIENKKRKTGPFPNMQSGEQVEKAAARGGDSGGSGSNLQRKSETPIDRKYYAIYRPFPNTHQVLMPYLSRWNATVAGNDNGSVRFKLRMNSIYDIFNTDFINSYTEGPSTADAQTGNINQPQMRNYWAQIYKYYTVVACKYKVTIRMNTSTRTKGQVMVYKYEHTQTDPPLFQPDQATVLEHKFRQHHPNCEFKALNTNGGFGQQQTNPGATTASIASDKIQNGIEPWQPNYINNTVTFTGVWHYGDIDHEIIDDDFTENWTPMGETPKSYENHTYIIQQSYFRESNVACSITYFVDLEYIVQLKDLTSGWKWIGNGYNLLSLSDPFDAVRDKA